MLVQIAWRAYDRAYPGFHRYLAWNDLLRCISDDMLTDEQALAMGFLTLLGAYDEWKDNS
jgi:hypothetical protein